MEATQNPVLHVMNERHSVRAYEKGYVISDAEIEEMLAVTSQAPSSWNLQHWKFLIIKSEEAKQKMLPIAYNQQQVVDSSFTVVVLGDLEADKNAERVYGEAVESGFMNEEVKNTLVGQIKNAYASFPTFARDEAILNASLAAMQLMLAAKAKGYDTCPIGGFDKQKCKEEFNVPDRYIPVMMITVGKAAKAAHASDRFPVSEVTVIDTF